MRGPLSLCVELSEKHGHQLWVGEVGRTGVPLLMCLRCGAFALAKPLLLMRPCAKQCAHATARWARKCVLNGKHPEDGRAIGKLWRVLPLPPVFTAALTRPQAAGVEGCRRSSEPAVRGSTSGDNPCGFDIEAYDADEHVQGNARRCCIARLRGTS